ncbi:MAG: BtpA/SgcQ family protein [bacterium]|nr:BtpA/SgcQ family protein [bacterium]
MDKLKKIFKNKKPFIIGMVHCVPLFGYENFPGIKEAEKNFISDLKALIDGGVDAIMIENNYDIPHYEKAKSSTVPQLTDLCLRARKFTKKPLGLCVLWNDYETALSIAKIANFQFVRIPVFVDRVKTDYGIYDAKADECIKFRKEIKAENILIFADVQVKHAEHLIKRPLENAVREAIEKKADAIIITGKWTGDPPTFQDVIEARKIAKNIPIILGSGITPKNIKEYDVDGLIVGSYFKGEGNPKEKDYHNIFTWKARIKSERVKKLIKELNYGDLT